MIDVTFTDLYNMRLFAQCKIEELMHKTETHDNNVEIEKYRLSLVAIEDKMRYITHSIL